MALVGNLKDLKLPNLIQLNCMERNVAKLMIEAREGKGELYFDDGQIVHATYRGKEGDHAVYDLLALKEGLFRIENGIRINKQSVKSSWNNLLLEGMRVLDEEKDTEKGKIKDLLQEVLAIKGVLEAEILNSIGEIVLSSVDDSNREGYSVLTVFSLQQGKMITSELGLGEMQLLNLKTPNSKIVCFEKDPYYIVIEYDQKLQIENLTDDIQAIRNF